MSTTVGDTSDILTTYSLNHISEAGYFFKKATKLRYKGINPRKWETAIKDSKSKQASWQFHENKNVSMCL